MQVRKRNQLGVGGGKQIIDQMKFLSVQHNEKMAGHGFAPNLWEKPDLKYMFSVVYEIHFVR